MKRKTLWVVALAAVGGAVLWAAPAGADEVALGTDRYGMVQYRMSTHRYAGPYQNYISAGLFNGYTRRTMIAFDLSGLTAAGYDPNMHMITGLTLKLTLRYDTSAGPENTVTVYDMAQEHGQWDPNTITTDAAVAALWDSNANVLGSHTYPADPNVEPAGSVTAFELSGVDLTGLVNSWINGNNTGIVIAGYEPATNPGTNFITEYQYTPGAQQLMVEYSTIPEPATLALLAMGGAAILVRRRRNAV